MQAPLVIHNPHALPMYREDRPHGKRKREKDRMDPIKSQAPERGSAAQLKPGTGGNIGVTGGTLLTQYILKNQVRCSMQTLPGFVLANLVAACICSEKWDSATSLQKCSGSTLNCRLRLFARRSSGECGRLSAA